MELARKFPAHLTASLALHGALALAALAGARLLGEKTVFYTVESGPLLTAGEYSVGEKTRLQKGAPSAQNRQLPPLPPESAAPTEAPQGAGATAAPSASGAGGDAQKTELAYLDAVRLQIERAKRYPPAARRTGLEGRTLLRFTITPGGEVDAASVARSSGYSLLDAAALETVRRAAPYPAQAKAVGVEVEIAFLLSEKKSPFLLN